MSDKPTNSDENRLVLQVQLERVHDKLDKISADIQEIKVQDAIQNEHLAVHIARTDALEKRVEQVDSRIDPIEKMSTALKTILAVITFLVSVPHIERLVKWVLSFFN